MIRVTFQSAQATLTDAQIADFSSRIVTALEERLGAVPSRLLEFSALDDHTACSSGSNGRQCPQPSRGSNNVKIEIYDQSYNFSAEQDEEYVKELAAFVDGKMRAVAEATRTVDSLKVAVLAAVNIADESSPCAGASRKSKARCESASKNA